jgi:hypothetical protein
MQKYTLLFHRKVYASVVPWPPWARGPGQVNGISNCHYERALVTIASRMMIIAASWLSPNLYSLSSGQRTQDICTTFTVFYVILAFGKKHERIQVWKLLTSPDWSSWWSFNSNHLRHCWIAWSTIVMSNEGPCFFFGWFAIKKSMNT